MLLVGGQRQGGWMMGRFDNSRDHGQGPEPRPSDWPEKVGEPTWGGMTSIQLLRS